MAIAYSFPKTVSINFYQAGRKKMNKTLQANINVKAQIRPLLFFMIFLSALGWTNTEAGTTEFSPQLINKAKKGDDLFEKDQTIKAILKSTMGADLEKKAFFGHVASADPATINNNIAFRTGCTILCVYDFVYYIDYGTKKAVVAIDENNIGAVNEKSMKQGIYWCGGDVVTVYGANSIQELPGAVRDVLTEWNNNSAPCDNDFQEHIRKTYHMKNFKYQETKYIFRP